MYLTNQRHAIVNRSSSQINVHNGTVSSGGHTGGLTAGGTRVGIIFPNEMYTLIPNSMSNITFYQIVFRDGNGNQIKGYIETSPGVSNGAHSWVKNQEPFHYYNSNGSSLVAATTTTISGSTYRVFTVKKAVSYKNPSGTTLGTLAVGTQIATNASTTGQTYPGYMYFTHKKSGSSWVNLVTGGTYGFVDLSLSKGATPSDRCIW